MVWFSKDNPAGHSERKKEEEADRGIVGKTVLKSGQKWTLPVQVVQLKQDKVERDCWEFICGAPKTF